MPNPIRTSLVSFFLIVLLGSMAAQTQNYVAKFNSGGTLINSSLFDNGNIGIGTSNPTRTLDVNGDVRIFGGGWGFRLNAVAGELRLRNDPDNGNLTLHVGNLISDSNVGIGTTTPGQKLEVNGSVQLTPGSSGRLYFPDGTSQGSAATGTISAVLPGTGLTGGGYSGNVTLGVDGTVARVTSNNTFTAQQTFNNYPVLLNNVALIVDNEQSSQYGVSSTVFSGIAGGFWNKRWYDTSWGTGSILAGWAGTNMVQMFRVDTRGTTYTYNAYVAGGFDYAELVKVVPNEDTKYEPGDVIVIDASQASRFALSSKANSSLVAGVYSTKPGLLASSHPMEAELLEDEIPLAILGQVSCKVTTENGAIEIGDLLVTSTVPGHAMRAGDAVKVGTVIGKALEPLPFGNGKINVLLNVH